MPRLSEQFLSLSELNSIKGLVHYLNESFSEQRELSAEVTLHDSNGERVGVVKVPEGTDMQGYSFCFLVEDPT